ncbi:hypothetical protein [Methanocella sp. MCL-LM]|uniref:hypothetical protein n=1 Tax=Methanocella sp. MCL-LM TaxID=3412035 RepID=UPI003C78C0B1
MQKVTPDMIEQWKFISEEFRHRLKPNRKSASDIIAYLTSKYPARKVTDEKMNRVVISNVLANKCFAEKLPAGAHPAALCYSIDNAGAGRFLYERQDELFRGQTIFVGVELVTGFFLVEGCSELWDELFAFRGLDEEDLTNFYLVAEYVTCLRKFNLLDDMLA